MRNKSKAVSLVFADGLTPHVNMGDLVIPLRQVETKKDCINFYFSKNVKQSGCSTSPVTFYSGEWKIKLACPNSVVEIKPGETFDFNVRIAGKAFSRIQNILKQELRRVGA